MVTKIKVSVRFRDLPRTFQMLPTVLQPPRSPCRSGTIRDWGSCSRTRRAERLVCRRHDPKIRLFQPGKRSIIKNQIFQNTVI